jgi:adenylate kinase
LLFEPKKKRVYLSFPMSHVMDLPNTLAEIDKFKSTIAEHFVCFDPGEVDEFRLHAMALKALEEGRKIVEVDGPDGQMVLQTAEVAQIGGDILGQIYARDFKTIDQSDMIVSLVPELPGGKPGLSSGVERELHHAFEGGKEVYVIWACNAMPSPFITETATKVFRRAEEAIEYFREKKYIP